jgi:hypothetical protein
MACISKLANAITYNCDSGATGFLSALIINKSDIASFTVDSTAGVVSSIALVPGAKAYRIDTVKRSLVMSESIKINEGAPNALSHQATIVYTELRPGKTATSVISAVTNGSFVILTNPIVYSRGSNTPSVWGLYYGLSTTSIERSSHDNGGWATVTMETPENVIGEDVLTMPQTVYDDLYAAAAAVG